VKLLEEKVEGWVTGLHLILQAYGNEFKKIASSDKLVDENIFGYFAEDIFKELNDNTKNFLMFTSLLDWFTSEMCSEIFGFADSRKILAELKTKNIFIESSQLGESESYSYHNLFRQFLLKKLNETKAQDEIKKIAGKIYAYFKKTGDTSSAIEFAIFGGEYVQAAGLIKNSFDELFQSGSYEILWKWLSSIPDEFVRSNLNLLFLRGKLLKFYKAEFTEAKKVFDEIRNDLKEKDELSVRAAIEISEILVRTGEPEKAIEMLEAQQDTISSAELKAKNIISLAKAYYRLGSKHYHNIIKLLDQSSTICDENDFKELQTEIYQLYGKIYHNRGDFIKSLHYYENVIRLEHNVYRKYEIILDTVLLLSWSGQYQKAKDYLDTANEIYISFPANAFKRGLMRVRAMLKFEVGDYEYSIKGFEELNEHDLQNKIKAFGIWYYLLICESYMFLDEFEKAREYLQLAKSSIDKNDEYQVLEYEIHEAILLKSRKTDPKVEKVLSEAHKYFDSLNLIYSKTQVEFHLADYYYKKGSPQTALKYLLDSLNTAGEKQYSSFLSQHFIQYRYLFDFASANNIRRDFIESIHSSLVERAGIDWLSPKCLKRIKRDSTKLYDISLSTFGGAEIFVRGNLVTDDKWIRKKSKLLLIYLLINQNIRLSKDKVLGIFFGELTAESAENIFHQAVTNIRNAVKPQVYSPSDIKQNGKQAKKSKKASEVNAAVEVSPSYIIYEDKILRIAQSGHYKIDTIELGRIHGLIKSPETEEHNKEKLAMEAFEIYRGEFLPGFYEPWVEETRLTLENKFIDICEHIIPFLIKNAKFEDAVKYSERLIEIDNLHEEAYINAIQAYSMSGNRNMAKKKFSQLLKNYEKEFGEKPSGEVLKRVQDILVEE
ncbi:MAG: hypothetical protein L0Y79_08635, partial [Chlorobi bacterium]|nr:hypothetical protein [Chlorobiota bacterium]